MKRHGQTTVEFAIILFGFLSVIFALGLLWRANQAGLLVDHALQSASHHIQSVAPGGMADVFLY